MLAINSPFTCPVGRTPRKPCPWSLCCKESQERERRWEAIMWQQVFGNNKCLDSNNNNNNNNNNDNNNRMLQRQQQNLEMTRLGCVAQMGRSHPEVSRCRSNGLFGEIGQRLWIRGPWIVGVGKMAWEDPWVLFCLVTAKKHGQKVVVCWDIFGVWKMIYYFGGIVMIHLATTRI